MVKYNRVGLLRRVRKISQKVLGDALGISQQNVSRIEVQVIPDVSAAMLCRIADYFQVSTDYLLERAEVTIEVECPDTDPLEIYKRLSLEDRKLWLNVGIRMTHYNGRISGKSKGKSRKRVHKQKEAES